MGTKVTELDPVETLQDEDQIYVVQGGESKSATIEQVGRASTETITNGISQVISEQLDEKITYGYSFKNEWPNWAYKMQIASVAYTQNNPLKLPFDSFVYCSGADTEFSTNNKLVINGMEIDMPFVSARTGNGIYLKAGDEIIFRKNNNYGSANCTFEIVPLVNGEYLDGASDKLLVMHKASFLEVSDALRTMNDDTWTQSTGRNKDGSPFPVGIYGTFSSLRTDDTYKLKKINIVENPDDTVGKTLSWVLLDSSNPRLNTQKFSRYALYAPFKVKIVWSNNSTSGMRTDQYLQFSYRYNASATKTIQFWKWSNSTQMFGMTSGKSSAATSEKEDFTGDTGGNSGDYGRYMYVLPNINATNYPIGINDQICNISMYNINSFNQLQSES